MSNENGKPENSSIKWLRRYGWIMVATALLIASHNYFYAQGHETGSSLHLEKNRAAQKTIDSLQRELEICIKHH